MPEANTLEESISISSQPNLSAWLRQNPLTSPTEQALLKTLHSYFGNRLRETRVLDFSQNCEQILLALEEAGCKEIIRIDSLYETLNKSRCQIERSKLTSMDARIDFVTSPFKSADFLLIEPQELPFADDSFDIVLSSGIFNQLTQHYTIKIMQELNRVLKPSGLILAEFENSVSLANPFRSMKYLTNKLLLNKDLPTKITAWNVDKTFPFLSTQSIVLVSFKDSLHSVCPLSQRIQCFLKNFDQFPSNYLSKKYVATLIPQRSNSSPLPQWFIRVKSKLLLKRTGRFGISRLMAFHKDLHFLKTLQKRSFTFFQVPFLKISGKRYYILANQNLTLISTKDAFLSLPDKQIEMVFSLLTEFRQALKQTRLHPLEFLNLFSSNISFLYHSSRLLCKRHISFQSYLSSLYLYLRNLGASRDFDDIAHGNWLSEGSLSLDNDSGALTLLNFEGVKRHAFFLYDWIFFCSKLPMIDFFKDPSCRRILKKAMIMAQINPTDCRSQLFLNQLSFTLVQILIHRINERLETSHSSWTNEKLLLMQDLLRRSLDHNYLTQWIETILLEDN